MKNKKKIIGFLLMLSIITGCASKSRDLENHEVSAKPVEIAETNYVKSPDGKHAITEGKEQYHVLLYKDIDKGEPKSIEIVGMNYRFLWSPDSSKVCVSYSGRIWSDFSIIDVDRENIMEKASIDSIIKQLKEDGVKISYELNENRPDPYLTPVEWSPDSKKILIFYTWFDKETKVQNGVFVYDIEMKRASRMVQYPPAESEHTEIKIPDDFKW